MGRKTAEHLKMADEIEGADKGRKKNGGAKAGVFVEAKKPHSKSAASNSDAVGPLAGAD
jgi:hypothetical protein